MVVMKTSVFTISERSWESSGDPG